MSSDEATTARDRFWHLACSATPALIYLVALIVLLLLLTLITLLFGTPGTGYYAIAQINLVLGVGTATAAGYVFYRCKQRDLL